MRLSQEALRLSKLETAMGESDSSSHGTLLHPDFSSHHLLGIFHNTFHFRATPMHPEASSELVIIHASPEGVPAAVPSRLSSSPHRASVAGSLLLGPLPKDVSLEAPAYRDLPRQTNPLRDIGKSFLTPFFFPH